MPAGNSGKVEDSTRVVALRVSRLIWVSVRLIRATPVASMVTKERVGRSTVPPVR